MRRKLSTDRGHEFHSKRKPAVQRWRLITDEERIAQRAVEPEALTGDRPPTGLCAVGPELRSFGAFDLAETGAEERVSQPPALRGYPGVSARFRALP